MRTALLAAIMFFFQGRPANACWQEPVAGPGAVPGDWLINPFPGHASASLSADGKSLVLANGLVERRFLLQPYPVCTSLKNLVSGEELIRSIRPEIRLKINGVAYALGGMEGQPDNAYFRPAWLYRMKASDKNFEYAGYRTRPAVSWLDWKSRSWILNGRNPRGLELIFSFRARIAPISGLSIEVHYVIYDGIPLLCKWLSMDYSGDSLLRINRVVSEILAVPEEQSAVVGSTEQMARPHGIYLESNYAFNNAMRYDLSDQTTHWKADSSYTSQVNYNLLTPCLLEVYPEQGPGIDMRRGDSFSSIRTFELLLDSYDRERRGLAIRRMYSVIAPWTTENPIFMHLVSRTDEEVIRAVDQCAATGYEALILSFGSHCNMEDSSAANILRWKSLADYAGERHVRLGAYSLFSSRSISDSDDVIDPRTGRPGGAFFGQAPCYGSSWGLEYLRKIEYFLSSTRFSLFENDGPYPGDLCASTRHPGHRGLEDSQWRQMELQKSLYHWCSEHGIYVNAPDWYFLDGTNKIALGYRETNFSLARPQQLILNRQNIYDGTWEKTPSMSWGFVPLTRYQGGGPEAVLEPLVQHLKDYEQLMFQYYGAGVQACYRGQRLYDTEETRNIVTGMIRWYKKYRQILNSDIIHLRRADGRDWDGWMHVQSAGRIKGMVLLFNPTDQQIRRRISLPLYYTGLDRKAVLREKEGIARVFLIGRDFRIHLEAEIPAGGYTWYTITSTPNKP